MPLAFGGGGNVGSAQITDGAITNADINAAAAIDISKLSGVAASGANTDITSLSFSNNAIVSLSSAEILNLNTTPKTLIAAPGANKVIVVESVAWYLTAGTAYTLGGYLRVQYNGDTNALVNRIPVGAVTSATDYVSIVVQLSSANTDSINATIGINKAVEISSPVAAFTTGTGTATVHIKYRIITS